MIAYSLLLQVKRSNGLISTLELPVAGVSLAAVLNALNVIPPLTIDDTGEWVRPLMQQPGPFFGAFRTDTDFAP